MGTVGIRPAPLPARGGRQQHGEQHLARAAAALSAGEDAVGAAGTAGAKLAWEGAGLAEALEEWRRLVRATVGGEPPFRTVQALAVGWSEEALGHALARTCRDPLTGLAGPAHLQARLEEVYREAGLLGEGVSSTHALVVVDMPRTTTIGSAVPTTRLAEAFGVLEVAERVRRVFPGEETVCRAHPGRLLVLARRTTDLGRDVARVRHLVDALDRGPSRAGVEDLPGTVEGAAALVAVLSRQGATTS